MSRLYGNRYRCIGITGLLWGLVGAIVPLSAKADVPLIRADVESLQNNVEVILQGQTARPATLSDWLGLGDALRTSSSSRAELRFNDGSLARIGERATFRFSPNTRNFRLSNGTVLLLIPPGNGPSTIQTPSAVTGVQGTALVIRHIPFTATENSASPTSWETGQPATDLGVCNSTSQLMGAVSQGGRSPVGCVDAAEPIDGSLQEYPGRTIVMVLTDNPQGPVVVTNSDGVTQDLTSGHMAVIEGDDIQVLEFDLSLFYQTSPLVEGLHLDDPSYEGSGLPTDPVRQETLDGLAAQDEFEGSYLLNPTVLTAQAQLSPTETWVVLPDQPSATGSQTARNLNKPIGLMSSLLVTRGVVNPNVAPAGVINPDGTPPTTAASNSSGSSTQTPSAKNPDDYSGSEPPQVGSNPPATHSPGPTPGSTPTEPGPTPGDTPGDSGQTPTTPSDNSGSDPVTPPSEPPAAKPSPTPGNGAETPTTDPGNAPGSSGESPSTDPTPPGPVNEPDPVVEPTPDPTPNPDPVVEPTPPGPVNDPGPVIEPTPDPTPDPGPVVEPTPPGPVNDPGPVIELTPDPVHNPDPVIEPTPDPVPNPEPIIEPTPPGPANDPAPTIELTPDPVPSPEPIVEPTPPGPANEPSPLPEPTLSPSLDNGLDPTGDSVVPNAVDNPAEQVDPTGNPAGDVLPGTIETNANQDAQDTNVQDVP